MAYKTTELSAYEYKPLKPEAKGLPLIIDDWTLAFRMGFRGKILWYLILNRENNYKVFEIPKKSGGKRIIHDPSPVLQRLAKRIRETVLLPLVDRLGDHVSSYRKGKSITDAASKHVHPCPVCEKHEQAHTCLLLWDEKGKLKTTQRQECVPCSPIPKHNCQRLGTKIKVDLKDFFPQTRRAWIRAYFSRVLGYNHYTSSLFATILTTSYRTKGKLHYGVPVGLVTSGDICNLIADWKLDSLILKELPGWTYTRYADDLYFSQPTRLSKAQINRTVRKIRKLVTRSGYRVNEKKVSVQTAKRRQKFLGATLNRKLNVSRKDYNYMRTMLHKCLEQGFAAQLSFTKKETVPELVSYLQGRLAFFETISKARTSRLKVMFEEAKRRYPVQDIYTFTNTPDNTTEWKTTKKEPLSTTPSVV